MQLHIPEQGLYIFNSPNAKELTHLKAELERLARLGSRPSRIYNRAVDLERLQTLADQLIAQESADAKETGLTQARDLLLLGTSMGDARPKAVVEDAGYMWVAKFNRQDDPFNFARVEHARRSRARSRTKAFDTRSEGPTPTKGGS